MTRFVLVVGALFGLSELAPAKAQFGLGPFYPTGYTSGYSYSYRSGIGFSFGGSHLRVSGFSGGFVAHSGFYAQPYFAPPYFAPPVVPILPYGSFVPIGPFGPVRPFGPVAPIGFAPVGFGFGTPFWNGWGPAFWNGGFYGPGFYNSGFYRPGFGPSVIIVPPPVILGGNAPDPNANAVAGGVPPNDPQLIPRGAKPTDFLVISPQKTVPEVTRVASAGSIRPPGPVIGFDPFAKAPALVNVERVEANPKKEAERLVRLGRDSFASADYGRAAEHFARACTSDPNDATAYFLLAQARFAAGRYADAVTHIREGLTLDAKWPNTAFVPTDLYGGRADRFAAHVAELKKAVSDNPGQPTLEFLLGYQLWFNGEKGEAEKLFRAAEKRLPAPGPIALFK